MPELIVHQGTQVTRVPFLQNTPLAQVLAQGGCHVAQPCGGRGVCGKCAVQLTGEVSAPTPAEEKLGVRLACQAVLMGNAEVIVPMAQDMLIETGSQQTLAADGTQTGFGAAIDVGTTTLALKVYDLATGEVKGACAMLNPQTAVAADVVGRMDAALKGRLEEQRSQIVGALQTMLLSAAAQANLPAETIQTLVITGNTTMLYLLTGKSPEALSHSPFEADCLFGETVQLMGRNVWLPPCMHAFVGADITCAVLASGMCEKDEVSLLCDVGTNGELALWKNGVLYITSTAAGPAFEGAGISCGCSSIRGAIDRMEVDGDGVRIHTIGNADPVGLCGSGLMDAVAALLDLEIIDETGAMDEDYALCDRVILSRADIRAVQLSKAAIAAGIQCLIQAAGCREQEVKQVYLAGGFGSHMNLGSAARIGLLPETLAQRVKVIGNAALQGSSMALLNHACAQQMNAIAQSAQHVALGGNPRFQEAYMDCMFFE